jgi:hypothetical protein
MIESAPHLRVWARVPISDVPGLGQQTRDTTAIPYPQAMPCLAQTRRNIMTKSFRGYVPIEPPSFDLESPDGANTLTVKCVGMLPGSRFLDFMSNIGEDSPKEMAKAVYDLLTSAVRPEGWDSFKAFIDNPDNGISMDLLAEMAGYLGEMYSKRPTEPSPLSSVG